MSGKTTALFYKNFSCEQNNTPRPRGAATPLKRGITK